LSTSPIVIGSAVQRPLERADRRGDGGVQVGHGPRGDAGRERRGVETVVELQDHGDVESPRLQLGRLARVEHPQEVRGVAERRIGSDRLEPLADALVRADDGRHARGETRALPEVRLAGRFVQVGIADRHGRDRGAQQVHRRGIASVTLDELGDARRQGALRRQAAARLVELGTVRELAVPKQVDRLLERGVGRQVLDGVAAVAEKPFLPVDAAQSRARRDDPFEPFFREHGGDPL
jgi:hypothetical protein